MALNDKVGHAVAGTGVALFGIALASAAVGAHLAPAGVQPLAAALAGLVAGITKEAADWLDNRTAAAAGQPLPHQVDPLDLLATAAPGVLLAMTWPN